MPGAAIRDRLAAAWRAATDDASSLSGLRVRPLAIGWATVELDRATNELGAALGLGDESFRAAPRSAVLGAACRLARGALPRAGSLLVIEPDTEGPLAESLARLGEGPVAWWLGLDPRDDVGGLDRPAADPGRAEVSLRGAGHTVSAPQPGPIGLEQLLLGAGAGPRGSRRLLVLGPAATIPL